MCFSYKKERVEIKMFSAQDSTQHGCFKTSGNHFSWKISNSGLRTSTQETSSLLPGDSGRDTGSQRRSPLNQARRERWQSMKQFSAQCFIHSEEMPLNSPGILNIRIEENLVRKRNQCGFYMVLKAKETVNSVIRK